MLESLVTAQADQIACDKLNIQELTQGKETLEEAVDASKWAHIQAKTQHTRTTRKLEKAVQQIEDLKENLAYS